MRIRLAETADIGAIRELVAKASEELAEAYEMPRVDELMMAGIVHGVREREAVVVAEQDGRLLGFCAWVHLPHSPPTKVEGLGTYVIPVARREHISCSMRQFAEEHAWRMGYRYVDGIAARDNPAGLESVLRRGFRVVGVHVRRDFQQPETATPRDESRGAAAVEGLPIEKDKTQLPELL